MAEGPGVGMPLPSEHELLAEIRAALRSLNQTNRRYLDAMLQLAKLQMLGPERISSFLFDDRLVRLHLPYAHTDAVQGSILRASGFFEGDLLEAVRPLIAPGGVIVDAGANIGNHTVFFAMFCGAAEVIAFEPMRRTFEVLDRNIHLNDLRNVRAVNQALGEAPGSAALAYYAGSNMGGTTLEMAGGDYPVTTIDALELPRLDFLKVDVEGNHVPVLRGAARTLARCRPTIWVELRPARGEVESGEAALQALGYRRVGQVGRSVNDHLFAPA